MVYCNGLENLSGNGGKLPENAEFSHISDAHSAPFPTRSADQDGAQVGTSSPCRVLEERSHEGPFPIGPDVPDVTRQDGAVCYFVVACYSDGVICMIKIGYSSQLAARLNNLSSHSGPLRVRLVAATLGGRDQERAYHNRFKAHSLGNEWFEPHLDILDEIARLSPSHVGRV